MCVRINRDAVFLEVFDDRLSVRVAAVRQYLHLRGERIAGRAQLLAGGEWFRLLGHRALEASALQHQLGGLQCHPREKPQCQNQQRYERPATGGRPAGTRRFIR